MMKDIECFNKYVRLRDHSIPIRFLFSFSCFKIKNLASYNQLKKFNLNPANLSSLLWFFFAETKTRNLLYSTITNLRQDSVILTRHAIALKTNE